jgi:hypothetical protein
MIIEDIVIRILQPGHAHAKKKKILRHGHGLGLKFEAQAQTLAYQCLGHFVCSALAFAEP